MQVFLRFKGCFHSTVSNMLDFLHARVSNTILGFLKYQNVILGFAMVSDSIHIENQHKCIFTEWIFLKPFSFSMVSFLFVDVTSSPMGKVSHGV